MIPINFEALNLNIRKAGKQGKTLWKDKQRRIYDHELMICIKGEIFYKELDVCHKVEKGQLLLIKPDTPHVVWINEELENDVIWIHFDFYYREDRDIINDIVTSNRSILYNGELPRKSLLREEVCISDHYVFPNVISLVDSDKAIMYMNEILQLYTAQFSTWQLDAKVALFKLFQLIIREYNQSDIGRYKSENEINNKIKGYIKQYYYCPITVKQLGNYLGYHPDYLGKIFKRINKITIIQYIHQIRIKHAMELLRKTSLSMEDIAEQLGYSDGAYFSKVFSKVEGVSPFCWKSTIGKKNPQNM